MTGQPFEYALLRAVPRVERGECVNVGVMVYCQAAGFLGARTHADPDRLRALDPDVDLAAVEAALEAVEATCVGGAAAGPVGDEAPGARFRWLAAPRSTVIQPGPIHSGVTDDPARELAHLFASLVL